MANTKEGVIEELSLSITGGKLIQVEMPSTIRLAICNTYPPLGEEGEQVVLLLADDMMRVLVGDGNGGWKQEEVGTDD